MIQITDEEIVTFIEAAAMLPISLSSNANQDYIEMWESVYLLALPLIRDRVLDVIEGLCHEKASMYQSHGAFDRADAMELFAQAIRDMKEKES